MPKTRSMPYCLPTGLPAASQRSLLFSPILTLALFASGAAQARPHPATQARAQSELPITRVALYKNGVGFFEHTGRVTGDQTVTIDFTSAQLNDVLQSLTAIDLNGGRISGAGYNSTTPLEQQLKSLPLALTADPTDVDFYNAIRGARVQVQAPGATIVGRLLSIDLRTTPQKEGEPTVERRFITVVSDAGAVRTLELTAAVSVALLDTALHTDVTRYLELLASTRNQGLRHLNILDRGTGSRELRVSYISEVPVWKSTYRILFSPDKQTATPTATLQGWSVVDNTTGSDWTNVHLDLIAGAPQSFIQPLSTPYYNRRPEIALPAEAQLAPQTHESGTTMMKEDGAPPAAVVAAAPQQQSVTNKSIHGSAVSMGNGSPAGMMAGAYGGTAQQSLRRGVPMLDTDSASMGGTIQNELYQSLASASLVPGTTTAAFDDFFEYSLTDPITIRKNESALVPILQTKLPVERVTLWSAAEPVALRALWMTNNSTMTLDRGSFSIVENGNFGGEGLLDPIHPNERRLLSYAADQAVHVSVSGRNNSRRVTNLSIKGGVLRETSTDIAELTYDVRNAAPEARTVVLEHPVRAGYTLSSDVKPTETTPAVYRFSLKVAPAKTEHLKVSERRTNFQNIRLVDRTQEQLVILLRDAHASDAALAALQPVFDAHAAVVALDDKLRANQAEQAAIAQDQSRLRENLTALKGTPEEKALATRYTGELNAQEDRLAALHKEHDALTAQRVVADAAFQARLNAVNLEETL